MLLWQILCPDAFSSPRNVEVQQMVADPVVSRGVLNLALAGSRVWSVFITSR